MAWPAAVLPCFISRFLYRPLSVYRLPGGVAATVGAVQPLMVVFISAALLGSPIRLMAVLGAICGT
ncbi:EamA family transporter, partial [Escherichia coli]|nr:EamA family transporter [Escherichia coli]EFF9756613.1 EamA family transporter [Escherichia coli]EGM7922087.1 EamA family transporter [Escherichia coli]EHW5285613.1 EamA family transporter [Escherichia coli]